MSAGLQELVMWPVELILRGGKPAAMAAIATGLAVTEREGLLLRQRGGRILLRHIEERTRLPHEMA